MQAKSETESAADPISIGSPPEPTGLLPELSREPLLSVVVPCRNPGRRLDFALESLRRQTYRHIEVIIIDGASTDGTVERLGAMCSPEWRVVSEADKGQAEAIGKGFALARGEILTWLNADDALLPEAAECWVQLLGHESRPALAYGGCFEWHEEVGWMVPAPWVRPPDFGVLRDLSDYIMQPAAAFRADAFEAVRGVDDSLHYAMDWDLWLKLSRFWPVAHTTQVLAMNRVHADTKTRRGGRERMREIREVGRRHGRRWFSPANYRYALVALSERSRFAGALRSVYKHLWERSGGARAEGAPARYAPSRIRALPLHRHHRLWVACSGDEDRLFVKLHGRCPSGYTVYVDGARVELRVDGCSATAKVEARSRICRRLDLPPLPGTRLLQVRFSKESEHTH